MKKIILVMSILLSAYIINAQSYNTGIGLRAGNLPGITIKHFVSNTGAMEGILSWYKQGFVVCGLYEFQKQIPGANGLNWFVGGGAHLGFWDSNPYDNNAANNLYMIMGLDVIFGLEYKIPSVPLSFSLDLKPSINLYGYSGWWTDGALTVRFCF